MGKGIGMDRDGHRDGDGHKAYAIGCQCLPLGCLLGGHSVAGLVSGPITSHRNICAIQSVIQSIL